MVVYFSINFVISNGINQDKFEEEALQIGYIMVVTFMLEDMIQTIVQYTAYETWHGQQINLPTAVFFSAGMVVLSGLFKFVMYIKNIIQTFRSSRPGYII